MTCHSLHPSLPIVATSSGQRHFTLSSQYDSDDDMAEFRSTAENTLRLWHAPLPSTA